jgi:hypothetical protein
VLRPSSNPRKRAKKSKTVNLDNAIVNHEPGLVDQNDAILDQDIGPVDESDHLPQGSLDVPVLHADTLDRIAVPAHEHGAVNQEVLQYFDMTTDQRTEELLISDNLRNFLLNEDVATMAALSTSALAGDINVKVLEEDDQAQSHFEISDGSRNIDPEAEQTVEPSPGKVSDEDRRQILRAEATMTGLPADMFDHESQYKGWFDVLISSSSADERLQADISKFVHDLDGRNFPQSLVDVEAFAADNTRKSWHTHCPHMDKDWNHLTERIHKSFPELKVNELTKPSGKKSATRMAALC